MGHRLYNMGDRLYDIGNRAYAKTKMHEIGFDTSQYTRKIMDDGRVVDVDVRRHLGGKVF